MNTRWALAISGALLGGSLLLTAQVKEFRPVTDAMLRNPAPGDWLNWRRTDNAWGYSPLDQINQKNVQQLAARVVVVDGRHRRAGGGASRVRRRHVSARIRAASFRRSMRRPAI